MSTPERGPLGEMLYARRQELGISQNKAAVQLDTNPETYSQWERGLHTPKQFRWIEPIATWTNKPRRWVVYACGLLDDEEYEILARELGGYLPSPPELAGIAS
jgi:transcriptional regulator with XRE-family HTH domain